MCIYESRSLRLSFPLPLIMAISFLISSHLRQRPPKTNPGISLNPFSLFFSAPLSSLLPLLLSLPFFIVRPNPRQRTGEKLWHRCLSRHDHSDLTRKSPKHHRGPSHLQQLAVPIKFYLSCAPFLLVLGLYFQKPFLLILSSYSAFAIFLVR